MPRPKKTVTEPTADRLRYDIDRGRGGDKVDGRDPAAAPLGTDDEAGGAPPTPAQIKQAYDYEIAPGPSSEYVGDYGVLIYVYGRIPRDDGKLSGVVVLTPIARP